MFVQDCQGRLGLTDRNELLRSLYSSQDIHSDEFADSE